MRRNKTTYGLPPCNPSSPKAIRERSNGSRRSAKPPKPTKRPVGFATPGHHAQRPGADTGQIAQALQVDRNRVHAWIGAWNEYGDAGLLEGHRSGRPAQLSGPQREQLADILDRGPVAHGLNTGVWTSPLIAQILEEEFAVSYHPGHVRRLLKQLNFSVQRPKTRLV